jgi:TonB-dependent starch-binding outer membrane protein SusC
VISEEGFYKSTPWLNRASFLKLRASTGTLGNQDIGDYRTTVGIETNRLGYNFGAGSVTTGGTQLSLANPDLQWQETQTNNVGLDLGMLQDRLTFSFDAYRTNVNKALVTPPLPWSLGTGEDVNRAPTVNLGSLRNTGTEFGLTYRLGEQRAPRAFRLATTATMTTTRNIVRSLGNGGQPIFDPSGVARTAVGAPIGTFFLVRTAGVFQSDAEVQQHTTTLEDGTVRVIQPTARAGDLRYVDSNRDGIINDDDRVAVGNGTPKYSYGLFFDGGWRSLDFGLNLRGAGGFKIFNAVRYWTDRGDDPSNFRAGYRPWTPENPSTTTPRIVAGATANNRFLSDRWVEDGNFLRVQNVTLGYRLPAGFVSRVTQGRTFESRIYLNAQNLHTFTDFTNWDPETLGNGNALGRGIDDGRIYPNVRTFSIGLDLRL